MPKSGGWMNNIKVVMGFLELAFALKFISKLI
jgi:thiol:disulfide interchange protein DsbD